MDPIDPFRRRPPRPHVHAAPHRTRADERAAQIDLSPAKLAAEIERLTRERDAALRKAREAEAGASANAPGGGDRAELEATLKARDDYLAALQRERAEFLNFKRRTAEEREASLGLAAEGLIRKVLALADDFDRAVESRPESHADDPWVQGITAIDRKLRQLLESEGVSPIEATRGVPFDPRDHEAVANVPGTGLPEGRVVEELRRGYRLRDRVIRPALVAVSQGGAEMGGDAATDSAAASAEGAAEPGSTTEPGAATEPHIH